MNFHKQKNLDCMVAFFLKILFCCNVSREIFNGKSSKSTTPLTKLSHSGMSSQQSQQTSFIRKRNIQIFEAALFQEFRLVLFQVASFIWSTYSLRLICSSIMKTQRTKSLMLLRFFFSNKSNGA